MGAHLLDRMFLMKPPKTYSEQVQLLKNKNIIIKNDKKVEEFLSRVNYYKTSGYYLPFIDKKTEKINKNLTFEEIEKIYFFDRKLSGLVYEAIGEIEIYIRTSIAYYFGHKYNAIGYEDANNFNKKHNHTRLMNKVKEYAVRNKNNPVIIHHNKVYGYHYPIWVIIEFFEFGTLSAFYRDMKNNDKSKLAYDLYGINYQKLESFLSCVNDLRNRCCHYSRLYYSVYSKVPVRNSLDNYPVDRKLFTQLMILKKLYPDKSNWNRKFIWPLLKYSIKYRVLGKLYLSGFPKNWLYYLYK